MSRPRMLAPALFGAMVLLTSIAQADDPLAWRSLDGGGVAFVTAGAYRLGATIGQPDAGRLSAGAFTLRGGFWIGGQAPTVDVAGSPPLIAPFRFYPPVPNPVRAGSRVAFDLPRASRVTLALFDLSGRAVRRWEYGVLPPGRQVRTWSAVDREGRSLSSGVYFLKLETDREQGIHKVLVVR